MGRVLPIVVAIALLVYALIDCLQTDSARFRSMNRVAWLAIIVIVPLIGPILWLTIGKVRSRRQSAAPPPRPLAPDDDPEFLRQLREIDSKHEKMLGDWEADLRKREQEIQQRADSDSDADTDAELQRKREESEAELRRKRDEEPGSRSDDDDEPR